MYHTIDGLTGRLFFETIEDLIRHYWSYYYYGDEYIDTIRVYDTRTCQKVEIDYIRRAIRDYRKALSKRREKKKNYVFRRGPVPGIRCWKAGQGYYRRPRTFQEISEEFPTRSSRGKNYLPTVWDEKYRFTQKNWKSQRKTQYKSVYKS